MAGYFLSPFGQEKNARKTFQIYAYERPDITLSGYDATLQGGALNRTSPYVIMETNITRPVFYNRFGFVLAYQGIFLEYFAALTTKEFATGKQHNYGGVQLAVGF